MIQNVNHLFIDTAISQSCFLDVTVDEFDLMCRFCQCLQSEKEGQVDANKMTL